MAILRVGCYERVSTDEQALRGFSIDAQIDNLTEYCTDNGLKLVGHYTDAGKSGTLPPLKRPALQQLLEDVQAGKIDMILFTKLDRWFRSVKEYFKVQEILDAHNVEWKAIHEDYDTSTANGRMAITIFLAIAQNERDKASERVKTVFEHKRKNKEVCFSIMPFGYMKQKDDDGLNRLVIDPDAKQMCSEFWQILIEHENLSMAIRHMNQVYGVTKDFTTWRKIVSNTFYYGTYRGIEDFCDPYVSKEDWDKIQMVMEAKKEQPKTKRTYLFSGLMHCPTCGKMLCPACDSNRHPEGVEYRYYRCRHRTTKCTYKRALTEKQAEKQLLALLPKLIEKEIATVEHESAQKIKPKYNLVGLRERLRMLNESYMAGNKTDEEYVKQSIEIKEMIAKAEQEAPIPERDISHLKALLSDEFVATYPELSNEGKRTLWQTVLKEIKLENNRVSGVVFKY